MKKTVSLIGMLLIATVSVFSQQKESVNAQDLAKANNPLANMKAFSVHNYYAPSLSGTDEGKMNSTMIRYAQPLAGGKVLFRATLPTFNTSTSTTQSSGLGGMNLFTTFTLSEAGSPVVFGAGPMVTTPNLTKGQKTVNGVEIENPFDDTPWSLGGALVLFSAKNPRFQYGGLLTYEHSVSAEEGKDKSLAIIQPFMMFQLGAGTYLRTAGSTQLDFENKNYYVPLGMGLGKVTKISNTVVNFFVEPQYTAYSNYVGASNFQVYAGVNFQFRGK